MLVVSATADDVCVSVASSCVVHQKRSMFKGMLFTIAIVLIILWLLGIVTSYTIGGFVHILLVVAVIMILIRLIRGERVL